MKRLVMVVVLAVLAATACGRGGMVSPGGSVTGEFPPKENTLALAWPRGEKELFLVGRPGPVDVYTDVYDIREGGMLVVEVESWDFDPVAVVVDADGGLVDYGEGRAGAQSAVIVLDEVGDGWKLLVFSRDDSRGDYRIVAEAGIPEDMKAYSAIKALAEGTVTGYIGEDAFDPFLDDLLREVLYDYVFVGSFGKARLYPFEMEEEGYVSVSLESGDFDTYLALLSVGEDEYAFVDQNDDYNGTDSKVITHLEPGRYLAMAIPYEKDGYGEFTLTLEKLDSLAMTPVAVEASRRGVEYQGEIAEEANFALAWWPEMQTVETPMFLDPFSPVAAFTFQVEEPGVYSMSARADFDICLTVLLMEEDGVVMVESGDGYRDMESCPGVDAPLIPGEYVVLVSSCESGEFGPVTFSWDESEEEIPVLRPGGVIEKYSPWEENALAFKLKLEAGREYGLSVESVELDPMIDLYMPDGEVLSDDDGGEGTNSLLIFVPEKKQAGNAFLVVRKFSVGEGTFTVTLE